MYDQIAEEGPPPIPERGTEIKLDAPYIDGPQWYIVMSPREELGMEVSRDDTCCFHFATTKLINSNSSL